MLVALVAAFLAGLLAWRHATRLDRLSLHDDWSRGLRDEQRGDERRAWQLVLLELLIAVAATTILQMTLLARLQPPGQ